MNPRFQTILRWVLGGVFLAAAFSKLADPAAFLRSVLAYELPIPQPLLRLAAFALPWFELSCGLLLLTNRWTGIALSLASAMLAIFLMATGQAWARGLHIGCGCFKTLVVGLDPTQSGLVGFYESAEFAFFHDLVLGVCVIYLLSLRKRAARQSLPKPS